MFAQQLFCFIELLNRYCMLTKKYNTFITKISFILGVCVFNFKIHALILHILHVPNRLVGAKESKTKWLKLLLFKLSNYYLPLLSLNYCTDFGGIPAIWQIVWRERQAFGDLTNIW